MTQDPASEPDVLTSVKASYSLRERTLSEAVGCESWTLQGARDLTQPLLPILIGPTGLEGASKKRLNRWAKGAEVVVGIDEAWLRRQRGQQKGPAADHQFAASVTATAIIVYVVLRLLLARFADGKSAPRMLILRMQSEGRGARRDEDLFAGSHGLFAVIQAVAQVLGSDAPVFMQGLGPRCPRIAAAMAAKRHLLRVAECLPDPTRASHPGIRWPGGVAELQHSPLRSRSGRS